jgi:hypothetical protein
MHCSQFCDVPSRKYLSLVLNPTPTIGPTLLTIDPDGSQRNACMFASPNANTRHVLAITCEPISKLGPEPEMFLF